MELPIILKYDQIYVSCTNQNHEDHIKMFDVDGVYLVVLMVLEKYTNKLIAMEEVAFDSLREAEDYLSTYMGIDFPIQNEYEEPWIDYD